MNIQIFVVLLLLKAGVNVTIMTEQAHYLLPMTVKTFKYAYNSKAIPLILVPIHRTFDPLESP